MLPFKKNTTRVNRVTLLIFCALMCSCLPGYTQRGNLSVAVFDSLWKIWSNKRLADTVRLNAMDNLSWDGYLNSFPDSAFYFANLQYQLALQSQQKTHQAKALHTMGGSLIRQSHYDSARTYFKRCLTLYRELNNKRGIITTFSNFGSTYGEEGNTRQAILYYALALRLLDSIDLPATKSSILSNIGTLYTRQGDHKQAQGYYLRSLATTDKGDIYNMAVLLFSLGETYQQDGDSMRARGYFFRSLKLLEGTNNAKLIGEIYNSMGMSYKEAGNLEKALKYHQLSLAITIKNGNTQAIAWSNMILADFYLHTRNYPEAIKYASKSLKMTRERMTILQSSKILCEAYKESGNYRQALAMYELFIAQNDSLMKQENKDELLKQKLDYDYSKKEAILRSENKVKDVEIRQGRILLIVLVMLLVMAGGIVGLVMKNRFLREERRVAAAKRKLEELKNEAFQNQMNSHFVFNAFNSVQEFILKNNTDRAHHFLSEFASLIRMILDHNRQKQVSLQEELELLQLYVSIEEKRISDTIAFTVQLANDIDKEAVIIPAMLLQPVVENSVWHGLSRLKREKEIHLSVWKEDNYLVIEIKDNGVGLDVTNTSGHMSHGLNIIKERLRLLFDGEPAFEYFSITNNEPGIGACVKLVMPLITKF